MPKSKYVTVRSIVLDILLIFAVTLVLTAASKLVLDVFNFRLDPLLFMIITVLVTDISILTVIYFRVFRPGKITLADLGLQRRFVRNTLLGITLFLPAFIIEITTINLFHSLGVNVDRPEFNSLPNNFSIWILWPFAALLAPFTEELFTRGVIALGMAKRGRPILGLFLSAAIFSTLHFSLGLFPAFFLLGLFLGLTALVSKSIVPGIVIHALINTMATIGILFS